jgi:hypothetical protein
MSLLLLESLRFLAFPLLLATLLLLTCLTLLESMLLLASLLFLAFLQSLVSLQMLCSSVVYDPKQNKTLVFGRLATFGTDILSRSMRITVSDL